jgi:hypothetical protein
VGFLCLMGAFALQHRVGTLLGLTTKFWAGFLIGTGVVACAAAIRCFVPRTRGG